MYRFKVSVVLKDGRCITKEVVEAVSCMDADHIINGRLWWDGYKREEYDLTFISKTRV